MSHNRPKADKETRDKKTKRLCGAGKPQGPNHLRQSHHSRGRRKRASTVGFGADFAQEAEEFVVDVKVGSSQLLFAQESLAAELLEVFGRREARGQISRGGLR